ncbi:MAG TPA: hypothetical protein P5102_12055, partial [Candidatus Competibacteraceae bacterium]|nr:hypothetical protein [Candidatus Competibacteraceae bacterium]
MKRPHSSSRLLTLLLLLGFWIAAGVVAPTGLWDPWPMARAQSRIDELKGNRTFAQSSRSSGLIHWNT